MVKLILSRQEANFLKIRLSAYNPDWIHMFESEASIWRSLLKDELVRIEHFGSTAVPGMKAKPVIDMMCTVKVIKKMDLFNEQLIQLGYDVMGEWGIKGRRFFRKGGENRTHHIHVYQFDSPQIKRHLAVRDYLRTHPEEVRQYIALKEQLVLMYGDTRDYSKAKHHFVSELEQRALFWYTD